MGTRPLGWAGMALSGAGISWGTAWGGAAAALLLLATTAGPVWSGDATAPRSGYVTVPGLEMYYEIHGRGEPLVLLHGALTTIDISFGALLPALAAERQVIALEQQAHGHTADLDRPLSYEQMADDTAAALNALGIKRADVLGYSMGGTIALQLAMRHPDIVRRLVVVSAAWDPAGLHPGVLEGIAALRPEHLVGSGLPETYAQVAPHPEAWPTLVEKVQQLDLGFEGWPAAALAAIEAPALIVVGDSDDVTPDHAAETFRLLGGGVPGDIAGLPRTRLAILPGTTHIGVVTAQTERLLADVSSFLAEPAAPLPVS